MVGETVSHYRILSKLGEGGMGVVYKAEDTVLKRAVALKFLPADLTLDAAAKASFVHEAQAASALDHPNIGAVHEVDESEDGRSFICMALYDGETLKQKIAHGPLDIDEALGIIEQVATGLKKAHESGIIHRDIKPANIIVTADGLVKIVDFGLAKLNAETRGATEASRAGTAAYMAPEQIQNGITDARSDLFSVGMVMYEMLTGVRPFAGEHEASLFYSIVYNEPDLPTALRPELSDDIGRIVMTLLQKDPEKRFQSCGELIGALESVRTGTQMWRPRLLANRMSRQVRRHKLAVVLGTSLVAIVIVVLFSGRDFMAGLISRVWIPSEKHIAVLPFKCITGGASETVLADGLMEMLTSKLTQFRRTEGTLWVVDASEIRTQRVASPSQAMRTFGVTLAVTGSIQRIDNGIRLTLNLVDTKTSRVLGSRIIDEPDGDFAGLQDDVLESLTSLLDIKLHPGDYRRMTAGGTLVSDAYEKYLSGRGYIYRYDFSSAIQMFRKAVQADSTYTLAYVGLGEAYWLYYKENSDPRMADSAIVFSLKATKLEDQLAPVRAALGNVYAGTGHFADAIHEFSVAMTFDSLDIRTMIGLAGAYSAVGDARNAELMYKKAISVDTTFYGGYNELGKFYYLHGRTAAALEEYKKVVRLMPHVTLGYNNLGAMYFYLNRWADARKEFDRSLEIQPNYPGYSNLGTLLYYQGHYSEAARAYESALKIDDHNQQVWSNLAEAYRQAGDTLRSRQASDMALKRAEDNLRLNPNDPALLVSLAGKYAGRGDKGKAKTMIERAISISPDNVVLMGRAAMVYEQAGDRHEALMLLARAFRNGYSPAEIENSPEMKGIRSDPLYRKILKERGGKNRR